MVDFDSAKASLQSMLNAAKVMREKRVSVLVFPEGNRALGEMEPFKEGAAFLAIKAQVPVVPIAIKGSREVLPPGSLHAAGGAIRLRVGQPISTKGLTAKDRAELTRRMEEAVGALLEGAPVHV